MRWCVGYTPNLVLRYKVYRLERDNRELQKKIDLLQDDLIGAKLQERWTFNSLVAAYKCLRSIQPELWQTILDQAERQIEDDNEYVYFDDTWLADRDHT